MQNHLTRHDAQTLVPTTTSSQPSHLFGNKGNQPGSVAYFNQDWVATSAFMILMMQVGFAMLEAGCVRYKNTSAIITKVILNTTITVLVWWLFGYGLAFGNDSGQFIGTSKFGDAGFIPYDYTNFVMQTAQATVAASIMSGGTAERMTFVAWGIATFVFSGWVYPLACHWVFGGGWLLQQGYHDYAGVGVIHLVGGTGALVTAFILKPRTNRFAPGCETFFGPYNQPFIAFGCLLLYSCWLFFNAGNVLGGDHDSYVSGLVAMNTFLAGSSGALTAFSLHWITNHKFGLFPLCNGMLTGLVAISGCCDDVHTWVGVLIGALGGVTYFIVARVLISLKIDDPIEAIPVHFGGGLIGTFLVGFFVRKNGMFYGGGFALLGQQLVAIFTFIAWSGGFNAIVLSVLKGLGWLRVPESTEREGIDLIQCEGESVDVNNYYEKELEALRPEEPMYVPQVNQRSTVTGAPPTVVYGR